MEFKEKELIKNGVAYRLSFLKLENAIIAFFYENSIRLGTLAIALPKIDAFSMPRSSVILGGKFLMASRILAERIAHSFNKIGIVSIYSSLQENEAFKIFMKLLEDFLKNSK
ncbi:MAG: hypothetical protein QW589_05070 [Candidatus Bathyarchaeia archaeon]